MAKDGTSLQPDQPSPQSFFKFSDRSWTAQHPSDGTLPSTQDFTHVALYSWNIDFMLPFPDSRMKQAIGHLEQCIQQQPAKTASIIYLQESTVSDLTFLAAHKWVRDNYHLTDVDSTNWGNGFYGTVTLVDKRLCIAKCFRVYYSQSRMQRDAFFTDVLLGENDSKTVRFCNTHLESLALEPPMRPQQAALAAKYMHDGSLHGAIMAGDFNAIQDFDRQLHSDHGLKDAYLELGGQEDSDAGYTWGQQATTKQRNMFGCSRMDKIFFCGGLTLVSFQRFGEDVEVENDDERHQITELGFDKPWITDHLGVMSVFEIDS